jgi:nicotinate-nucleotide adenylyltransferase
MVSLKKRARIGLLGGSFNPAHGGHRHISVAALRALRLDAVWWLVSPQNPLKPAAGMAPLAARLASARAVARHPRIVASRVEADLGTQRTVDTVAALRARYPQARFVWLMGADNLAQFHRWAAWRTIAALLPIVVIARPGYMRHSQSSPAMAWLRRWRRRNTARWGNWPLPAIGFLHVGYDPRSATALRQHLPDWANEGPMD